MKYVDSKWQIVEGMDCQKLTKVEGQVKNDLQCSSYCCFREFKKIFGKSFIVLIFHSYSLFVLCSCLFCSPVFLFNLPRAGRGKHVRCTGAFQSCNMISIRAIEDELLYTVVVFF